MSKVVVFDFVCDTAVAVAAELGTDPNDECLRQEAIQRLIQQLSSGQAEVHCDNSSDLGREEPIQDYMDIQIIF
jgi:ABC-type amino acid transport substrate-binding protein